MWRLLPINFNLHMMRTLKSFIRQHPVLYFNLVGWRESVRRLRARRDTELVVEAFPRSANTTSVLALLYAQGESFKVAHHLHVPAHIKYAVRHRIPCLVIVRNPLDCVASLMVMRKGGHPSIYLKDYIDFARVIEKLIDNVIVFDFREVTRDGMGPVIQAVNKKFKTDFNAPSGSPEENNWVQKRVRELNHLYSSGDAESLSIPSDDKRQKSEEMKHKIRSESPAQLREAEAIYKRLFSAPQSKS